MLKKHCQKCSAPYDPIFTEVLSHKRKQHMLDAVDRNGSYRMEFYRSSGGLRYQGELFGTLWQAVRFHFREIVLMDKFSLSQNPDRHTLEPMNRE